MHQPRLAVLLWVMQAFGLWLKDEKIFSLLGHVYYIFLCDRPEFVGYILFVIY